MRDIRAIAVDATGQLWVAEGDDRFGRFSVWRTEGKQGTLVGEIFGPLQGQVAADPRDPLLVSTGELQWKIDPAKHLATLTALLDKPLEARPLPPELRDDAGLLLWTPADGNRDPKLKSGTWSVWRGADGQVYGACSTQFGTHVFALPGLKNTATVARGTVTIAGKE